MAGRNGQVARLFTILSMLDRAPHGLTIQEIADRVRDRSHPASNRTVYRDMQALEQSGFPLMESAGPDNEAARWHLNTKARITDYLCVNNHGVSDALALAISLLERHLPENQQNILRPVMELLAANARRAQYGRPRRVA